MESNSMSPSHENSEGQEDRVSSAVRAARRERKRQTDREAQRHRRARTRTHVAHLEKTVKDLTEALEKQEKASWPRTLQQQHLQIERLSGVLETIHNLTSQVRGGVSASLNSSKEVPDVHSRVSHKATAGFTGNEEGGWPSPEQMDCSPAANNASSTVSLSNHHDSHTQQRVITPENAQLRKQLLAGHDEKNMNYFELINNALVALQARTANLPSSSFENDEDIAIRVVVNGWDAARQKYELDEGWAVLETFDEGLFKTCGFVERLAMVRLMRAIFVSKINTSDRPQPNLPSYMTPTQLQLSTNYANIVDYFAWPNFRDLLIISRLTFVPEMWVRRLFSQVRLAWPYDIRDAYKHLLAEDKYRFSQEFDEVYSDLKSWQVRSDGLLRHILETKPLLAEGMALANGTGAGGLQGTDQYQQILSSCLFNPSTNEINDLNVFDVFSLME